MTELEKCEYFLQKSGYVKDDDESDYLSFHKKGFPSVDINEDEIVFINDTGDFLTLPLNYDKLVNILIKFKYSID